MHSQCSLYILVFKKAKESERSLRLSGAFLEHIDYKFTCVFVYMIK